MYRRCLNCMKEFGIPKGYEQQNFVCPFCGYQEGSAPDEIYHLYPGTVLQDRYIVGTVLGFGGFGVTYKAWDEMLNTVVAIKEYYPTGLVQRVPGDKKVIVYEGKRRKEYFSGMVRFLDEARNMAKFHDNPNIVHVENFFEENNTAYIVMEFLDGISLKGYLAQEGGKVDTDLAVEIVLAIISALKQIHSESILHRDISPDNIFLCEGNKIKLIDFGAARFSDEEKEVTRSIILKPGFAPPEQYQSKSKQGPWTDIYALSATLYRMVTGTLPDESVNRVVEDEVKAPNELNNSIPEYLSNTIMKGMALNAELRFRNVDDLKKALINEKKVLDIKDELKKRKKQRIIGIAAAVLLLAVGGIIAYSIYDKKDPALKEATVTIWVSYAEDELKDEKESMLLDMSESFVSDNDAVTVKVEAIPQAEYEERLLEASNEGRMPTVFETDNVSDEILEKTTSMDSVYKNLDDIKDYYFLKEYKKVLLDCHQVPLGFNVPVAYVRRGGDIDISTVEITGYEEMRNKTYYILPKYYAMYMQSFGGKYEYSDKLLLDDTSKKMLDIMSNDIMFNSNLSESENMFQCFSDGKLTYYLASIREYAGFVNSSEVAGKYEMRPVNTEELYGEFTNLYSISATSGKDEKKAAEVWLRYMLEEGPQKTMHIVYKNSLPINKAAYKEFINIDRKCSIIDSYLDKLTFYPKTRKKLADISARVEAQVVKDKEKGIDEWLLEQ